jgi:hypothetical protein
VDLHGHAGGPRLTELADGDARLEQERPPRPGPGLGEPLGRHHAGRDPGVDERPRQGLGRGAAAGHQRLEPHLPGVGDAVVEGREGAAVHEVGDVDDVPRLPQPVGEGLDARRETLDVVEQNDLGHDRLLGARPHD